MKKSASVLARMFQSLDVRNEKRRQPCRSHSCIEVQTLEVRQVLSAAVEPQILQSVETRTGDPQNGVDGQIGNIWILRANSDGEEISVEYGGPTRLAYGMGVIAGNNEFIRVKFQTQEMRAGGSLLVVASIGGKAVARATVSYPAGWKDHSVTMNIGKVRLGTSQLTVELDPSGAINEGDAWRRSDNLKTISLIAMDPKAINVVTHGFGAAIEMFGQEYSLGFLGLGKEWTTTFPGSVQGIPKYGSRFEGRVYTQATTWDSSDGWIQAMAAQVARYSGVAPPFTPGNTVLNLISKFEMMRARWNAEAAAQKIVSNLQQSGQLLDPAISQQGLQNIHLIGHSRGAAVNARVAALLTELGYRIDQYTALDGYSTDWAAPFNILADLSIVDELGAADVRRKVNYLVQDGLLEAFLIPVAEWFSTTIDAAVNLPGNGDGRCSEATKEKLRQQLPDAKAPNRTLGGNWENSVLAGYKMQGNGQMERSNHMNVASLYFESGSYAPVGQQYLYNSFVGQQREAKLLPSRNPLPPKTAANLATAPAESIVDGGFESLSEILSSLNALPRPTTSDSGINAILSLFSRPDYFMSEVWGAVGSSSIVKDPASGNSWLELQQSGAKGDKTSITQSVVIPDIAPTLATLTFQNMLHLRQVLIDESTKPPSPADEL